ncbi:hypothetical protein FRC11_000152, partial [Ceratobasidium sp. 423]
KTMKVPEDEFQDTYSDIELDEEVTRLLDRDFDDFEFGSEEYRKYYRKALAIETKARTKLDPFDWQLDVAVNTHPRRDVFLAGTGFGKTLALVMPAFLSSNLTIFLVSPLNALADAQVKEFDR